LLAIDAFTLKVAGSIEVGERPWGVALSPDGRYAYTANGPSNDVTVVDTASMKVVEKIPVGERPWGIVVVEQRR
jgi:YVTN family beta-propeller protein